ncbi:uncharacterized protein LOC130715772 [Lotus japonicus]|uniref:uncharacterized protein LOC130715772 n=1 Tax=Lotus japonicus TaxID=34305 RepID=UPI0025906059|nr:uncharacterized protein LOC130715772 [Lotus japonicus]
MANQDKRGFMYIYKVGIGNGNQRNKELEHAVEKEKKSKSRSWLQRIRNPTRTLNNVEKSGNRNLEVGGFVEARKSTSCLELGLRGGFVEGRKSVSSMIEASSSPAVKGIIVEVGRKSVSSMIEASSSPAVKGIIVEEGRKSVSHIETKYAAAEKARGGFDEGRKSVSQIETFSSVAAYLQVKVLVSDMPSFMQVHAFRCARRTHDSQEKFSSKHIAHNIKKEFDKAYGPVWHCIVGSGFGSFVTHSRGCFLYFSMENLYILLFKTKVKKAVD